MLNLIIIIRNLPVISFPDIISFYRFIKQFFVNILQVFIPVTDVQVETVGDLMGILMVLCNSGILQISGERGEDKLLKDNTVSIRLNPVLSSYLEIGYTARGKTHTLSLQDALLNIRSYKVFNDLLKWEKMNYLYQSALKSAGDNPNEATQAAIDEIAETKEKVELELQKSQMLLDISDGIKVK